MIWTGNGSGAAAFLPDGWLRDFLTFTWDNRSLEGTQKIADYVATSIARVNITNVRLTDDAHFLPTLFDAGPGVQGVEFGYTYETDIALGKGIAKVLPDASGAWKALTVSMIIVDLKGYEEPPGRQNFEAATNGRPWGDVEAERRARVETDPHVLISTSASDRAARARSHDARLGRQSAADSRGSRLLLASRA